MATIKDVAELYGFSITTVSRVLNNDLSLSVSDETKEKIFQAADKLNYRKKSCKTSYKKYCLFILVDGQRRVGRRLF